MPSRLGKVGLRILRYWTWWRTALLTASIILAAIAAVVDTSWLAVVCVVAAFGPVAALLALSGARIDQQFRRTKKLQSTVDRLSRASASLKQDQRSAAKVAASAASKLRGQVATTNEAVDALSGAVEVLNDTVAESGAPNTSLLVRCTTAKGLSTFLDALQPHALGAQVLVIDRTPNRSVSATVVARAASWPGLAVIGDADGPTAAADLEYARELATGRFLLVATPEFKPSNIAAIAELLRAVPPAAHRWHGWRHHDVNAKLVLISATALRELGGMPTGGLDAVAISMLERLGYVGDRIGDEGVVASPLGARASTGRRSAVRVDSPEHQLSGRIVLMPQASYHVEEFLPLARALRKRGLPVAFMVHDRWWPACKAMLASTTVPVFAQPTPGAWQASLAAMVTMNDWAKHEAPLIETARSYGVPTLGKVEGVQDFHDVDTGRQRRPYQRVERVLCQGDNDVEVMASLGQPTAVVGSSRLEQIWHEELQLPDEPLVVVNLNFTWGVLEDGAEAFLATVAEACALADIAYVVSMHPSQKPVPGDHEVADVAISELLKKASVLVSRFSTVPFEAMARGVPFIYHNPHGEVIETFAEPQGAFEMSSDGPTLAAAIERARTWRNDYRARSQPFFERQISIDPAQSSADRAADVLAAAIA